MPVYNAERFLDESMNSILNQTFDDLELICVDDGSDDDSLNILNEFKNRDSRVKVYSRNHEGGGNARNYGLSKVSGDYLFHMDADDVLELNAFEDFYKIAEEKDLDLIVFKAINYGVEKDHFFETDYQNMERISSAMKDNVFNYEDLGDLIFDFNVSPWCKFYNMEFIKKTNAKFRENSKFHDNQFFWDIIFQARRIYFIDEFYYTRKRYNESLTASGDKNHMDIIGVVNDIIKLFIKHAKLEKYKHELYNLKITWIIDRYNQINENFKEEFYIKMKDDFRSLQDTEFQDILDKDRRFIFDNVNISKNYHDLEKLNRYVSIKKENKSINENVPKINDWLTSMPDEYKNYCLNSLKNDLKDYSENDFDEDNVVFYENIMKSANFYEFPIYCKISDLKDEFKNKETQPAQLDFLINEYEKSLIKIKEDEKIISDLTSKLEKHDEILKNKTVEISRLKSEKENLNKKNNYLKNKSKNKNTIKKLFFK